jgi:hypothetical protein
VAGDVGLPIFRVANGAYQNLDIIEGYGCHIVVLPLANRVQEK